MRPPPPAGGVPASARTRATSARVAGLRSSAAVTGDAATRSARRSAADAETTRPPLRQKACPASRSVGFAWRAQVAVSAAARRKHDLALLLRGEPPVLANLAQRRLLLG
jgi:hypothetical protein